MARGNKYICATCGKAYEYCPKCEIRQPSFDAERYCSQEHSEIFAILSKHGCGNATVEETLASLTDYDITGLAENIQAHIDLLVPKKAKTRKEVVSNEETAQE